MTDNDQSLPSGHKEVYQQVRDEMARHRREHREAADRKRLPVLKRLREIADQHPKANLVAVAMPFHGYGDSGQVDLDSLYPIPLNDELEKVLKDSPGLASEICEIFESALAANRGGWENNEGACGTVELRLDGTVYADFRWREEVEQPAPFVMHPDGSEQEIEFPQLQLRVERGTEMVGLDPVSHIVVELNCPEVSEYDLPSLAHHLNIAYHAWLADARKVTL